MTEWQPFTDGTFDSDSLRGLFQSLADKWTPGSFAAEAAHILTLEYKYPEKGERPLDLRNITTQQKTTRFDAILTLRIPLPGPIQLLVDEFINEADRLKLTLPKLTGRFHDEIAICHLAFLHRRILKLATELDMRLELQCPDSSMSPRREELLIMGLLPFGGQNTVYYSALPCNQWSDESPAAIEHAQKLKAIRDNGKLVLTAS